MRLLIAEDDPVNVDLFVASLGTEHELVIVRDGAAALRAAAGGRPFDLVLLDVRLPGMDGLAVCTALRTRAARLPIIAVSASAMPEDVTRGLRAGFTEYLSKPVSPRALRAVVRRHAR